MESTRFERICRTSSSEAYLLVDGDEVVARLDLHFTTSVVYGVLVVEREIDDQAIADIRAEIDEEIVQTADVAREDFLLAVYRGTPVRQQPYSDDDDDIADEPDDER